VRDVNPLTTNDTLGYHFGDLSNLNKVRNYEKKSFQRRDYEVVAGYLQFQTGSKNVGENMAWS
jgi:hypothetical protein